MAECPVQACTCDDGCGYACLDGESAKWTKGGLINLLRTKDLDGRDGAQWDVRGQPSVSREGTAVVKGRQANELATAPDAEYLALQATTEHPEEALQPPTRRTSR